MVGIVVCNWLINSFRAMINVAVLGGLEKRGI